MLSQKAIARHERNNAAEAAQILRNRAAQPAGLVAWARHVAPKFLAAHLVSDPEIRKRFEREAGAVGGTVVDHENLRGTVDVFAQESRHLFERSGQPLFFVVGRDDDGKGGEQGGRQKPGRLCLRLLP